MVCVVCYVVKSFTNIIKVILRNALCNNEETVHIPEVSMPLEAEKA